MQDPTLLAQVDLLAGLPPDAYVLVNSTRTFEELGLREFASQHRRDRLLTVPATDIARRVLNRPLPNIVLLGGFAAMTGLVGLDSVRTAARERFAGRLGELNAAAASEAFDFVAREKAELVDKR